MNAKTGEILSLVSLPDFNPNQKSTNIGSYVQYLTVGAYEMGSTFKIINSAIAFDTNAVHMDDTFDVSKIFVLDASLLVTFIAKWHMTVEILQKSSNIGSYAFEEFGPIQKYYMNALDFWNARN